MIDKLIATVVLAATTAMDGTLPLYPHGTPAPGVNVPASALAQGVPYQQTTSVRFKPSTNGTKQTRPKSCSRMSAQGAVRYTCSGWAIVIQSHGGTIISFVPVFQ